MFCNNIYINNNKASTTNTVENNGEKSNGVGGETLWGITAGPGLESSNLSARLQTGFLGGLCKFIGTQPYYDTITLYSKH